MDKLALRSSWARRSRCADGHSTRLVIRQDKAASYEFRYPASDQAEPGRLHLALPLAVLSPLPLFLVKLCRRRGIKKLVFASFMHLTSCSGPTRTGAPPSANHNATGLGLQFDFVYELGFLQKRLWQAYAPRITDLNNAAFHLTLCGYVVITRQLAWQADKVQASNVTSLSKATVSDASGMGCSRVPPKLLAQLAPPVTVPQSILSRCPTSFSA